MWKRFFQDDFSEMPVDVAAAMEAMMARAEQMMAELLQSQHNSIHLIIIQPLVPEKKNKPQPLSVAEAEKTGKWLNSFQGDFNRFLK